MSGRDGEADLLDGPFGVAAEGHVVGGEAGDRLDGWWVPGERGVFGGPFGVLGDSQVADAGLDPSEQRVHAAEPKVIVTEPRRSSLRASR